MNVFVFVVTSIPVWLPLREVSGNPLKPITAAILGSPICPTAPPIPPHYPTITKRTITLLTPPTTTTTHTICGWRPMWWWMVTRVTVGGRVWKVRIPAPIKLGDQNLVNSTKSCSTSIKFSFICIFFSCPEQLNRTPCLSLGPAPLTIRVSTTLQSDPRHLWPLRHLIRVMKRVDLT